jgi:hypothetical protein
MKKFVGNTVGLLFAAVLSACGGGGGGGGGGGVGTALQPLAIDASNAMQVTAAVLDASGFVVDTGNPGGPITGVVVQEDGTQVDLAKVIRSRINLFSVLRDQNTAVLASGVIVSPTPQDCTTTGTVTVSGEIADPDLMQLTAGDTLTLVFKNCNEGDGLVLNGTMNIVVVAFFGTIDLDPNVQQLFIPPYDFTFDTTLTNLSITDLASGAAFTANGDITLREATIDGDAFNSYFWGTSLTARSSTTSDTLENFLVLSTSNLITGAYTFDSGGDNGTHDGTVCCATLSSTALGGTVDFDTLQFFAGVGDNYPFSGHMDITGATVTGGVAPSMVMVDAVDAQCVSLQVDPDGRGVTDIILTSWASLPTGIPDSSLCPP